MSRIVIERDRYFKAVNNDDNLGIILRIHLSLEQLLNIFLEQRFECPDEIESAKLSFAQKVSLSAALGLSLNLVKPLREINKLRNEFAHNSEYEINHQALNQFFNSFNQTDRNVINQSCREANDSSIKFKLVRGCTRLHALLCAASSTDEDNKALKVSTLAI